MGIIKNIFITLILFSLNIFAYFEYWFEMGQSATDSNKKIEYYTNAIKNWRTYDGEENLSLAYLKRAEVYYEQKDLQKSTEDLNQAIKYNPKLIEAYFLRGKIYLETKQYDLAVADLQQVIKLDEYDEFHKSNGGITYFYLAKCYFEKGQQKESLETIKKSLEFNRSNYEYFFLKAQIYEQIGEPEIALEDYTTSLSLNPKNIEAYLKRAKLYISKNDKEQALKDLTEAIKLDENRLDIYILRAEINFSNKKYVDVVKDLSKVIEAGK